ncbi:MAG: DUF177 domain-containing protein [Acidobacteriota bacterium]|nr:MAG: DUF177 domain-containing protein [Acidobacteriota bacterium]
MLLDLERVPPEGQVIDCLVDPSALPIESREFRITEAVSVSGRLVRADADAYRLSGRLVSEVEFSCVRCLEPFRADVREDLDLLYLPQSDNVAAEGEHEHGLGDAELAVSFYRDDEIDLAHMIWEQIVLALPMKPVCKPDCQGLCPDCGVNRNIKSCSCVCDTLDPRWQSLKSLLEP